tara:strand:+ start:258 stop:1133 length:876 start_codon:yes stop_codon:yes gene_type:complete
VFLRVREEVEKMLPDVRTPQEIIQSAIDKYKPIQIALLFSGGHDSLVNTHLSSSILKSLGYNFVVYHGDTTIGIPETQDYVKSVCKKYNWELVIRKPPKKKFYYEEIVKKYGFPGPTKNSHRICFRFLKERALRSYVTHECKSKPHAIENVLLLTGVRKSESQIRMGYIDEAQKEASRIWANPIFWWSERDCEKYMLKHNLPRNSVKDKICISGECLCGAFADQGEYLEIKEAYPHVAERIDELHEMAKENGHPWPWSSGPTKWYKHNPPGQINMFMCVGCETKRADKDVT